VAAKGIVSDELSFVNGLASNATILVPCNKGPFICITARDRLHTLRRTADATDGNFGIVGTQYVADFTGHPAAGGDWLIGGNLNDDGWIDILDFGVFSFKYGVKYRDGVEVLIAPFNGNTTCSTGYPHADINGDGLVGAPLFDDFTFIQINFLASSEDNCCLLLGDGLDDNGPITAISVADLYAHGLGELAIGDLNNDGWLNEADIVAFMNGARPHAASEGAPGISRPAQPHGLGR
jgi:hypothetical protein